MLWREESDFGFIFSLTLTKKRPFFGLFLAHFRLKNFSTGSDSEPHMTETMHLSHMKALTSWFHGRSLVPDWYSVSPSRKRGFFYHYFFSGYFWRIFFYRTSLPDQTPSPTCQHDVSNLFEGSCIVLWQEESNFGLIFSLSLTKKGHLSLLFFLIFLAHFWK